MYPSVHMCECRCMHLYTCVNVGVSICECICMHLHMCVSIGVSVCESMGMHICICICVQAYALISMSIYVCVCFCHHQPCVLPASVSPSGKQAVGLGKSFEFEVVRPPAGEVTGTSHLSQLLLFFPESLLWEPEAPYK